jgi:membrane fusion protein, multidrug efflux system
MNRKISGYLFVAIAGLLGGLILCGCQKQADTKKQQQVAQEIIPVRVVRVELKDMYQNLEYIGNIKAQEEVLVYPKVSGKIIEKVKQEGDTVTQGEPIAYIDRDEVGLTFAKAPVETPLAGVVGRVFVDRGTQVMPQTPVALVVSMDRVKISLDIPQIYTSKITLNQKAVVSVDAYPQEEFVGTITKISPVVTVETRAAPVEITIENQDHRLRSGMFARVSLVIAEQLNVPAILKEAIIGKDPDTFVYVVENDKARMQKISVGIHEGPFYAVTQGLQEGQLVVIVGQQRLFENAQVRTEIANGDTGGSS